MVGGSPAMRQVFEMIRRFALCDAAVLVTGETGTGKELVAKAIHERSSRRAGPFVAVNCAAMPVTLIASELFGYERGAFTGAFARKLGLIERADKGTLFLDEIGDLPAESQGHLLRFLQEGLIVRVGGHKTISVDVRIIAATNVRLAEAISAGRFRDDLFYRLNVLTLAMPPLREREGDIELLARFFLRMAAKELDRDVTGFDESAGQCPRADLRRAARSRHGQHPLDQRCRSCADGAFSAFQEIAPAATGRAADASRCPRPQRVQQDPDGAGTRHCPRHPLPDAAAAKSAASLGELNRLSGHVC
jgi:sigma54-dependent transcription regulator